MTMRNKALIEETKQRIADLKFKLAVEEAVLLRLAPDSAKDGTKSPSSKKSKPPRRNSLAAQAQEILTKSPKPLQLTELENALIEHGFAKEEDREKLKTQLPSALSRRKDIFVLVGKSTYDLVGRKKDI
jgi:hypothetical protein